MYKSRQSIPILLASFTVSLLFVFFVLSLALILFRAGSPPIEKRESVTYIVRLSDVDNQALPNFKLGDLVTDSVTKTPLGRVTGIQTEKATREVVWDGALLLLEDQKKSTVTLSITESLSESRTTGGGIAIRAGKTLHLRLPLYTGSALCLGFAEAEEPALSERICAL